MNFLVLSFLMNQVTLATAKWTELVAACALLSHQMLRVLNDNALFEISYTSFLVFQTAENRINEDFKT